MRTTMRFYVKGVKKKLMSIGGNSMRNIIETLFKINRRSWAPVWFNNGQGLPANLVLIRIRMGKVRANNQ